MLVLKSWSACATTKKRTILVYVTLNGKGVLTGLSLHGYSLFSVHFTGQSQYDLVVVVLIEYLYVCIYMFIICAF